MDIPKHITAAVLEKTNKPLALKKLFLPKLKKGQVLVKIFYSGICGSQLMESKGYRGKDKFLPHLLGHEATGIVIKKAKFVSKVKIGDRVILGWIKGNGSEASGAIYRDLNNKKINSGPITTLSNFSIISENRIVKLPKSIPNDIGVLFGCAFPTGMGMIFHLKKKYSNIKNILIIGLGGVGFSALLAAVDIKIKKIIVVDKSKYKLNIAKKINNKIHAIKNNSSKLKEKILSLTNQHGVDFCVECAGLTSTIETGFKLLNKNRGKLIFASHPKSGDKIKIDPHELISGKKIEGAWGGHFHPDKDLKKISILAEKNKTLIRKYFVNKKYYLKNINQAFKDFNKSKIIRPIIKM
tara:strand:- start:1673 stop:2731 length:1059 start_codon:yes stop_codon:yes gene_type:complete